MRLHESLQKRLPGLKHDEKRLHSAICFFGGAGGGWVGGGGGGVVGAGFF